MEHDYTNHMNPQSTTERFGWVEQVTEKALLVRLGDDWNDKSATTVWIPKSAIASDRDGYHTDSVIFDLEPWFAKKVPGWGKRTNRRNFPAAITPAAQNA